MERPKVKFKVPAWRPILKKRQHLFNVFSSRPSLTCTSHATQNCTLCMYATHSTTHLYSLKRTLCCPHWHVQTHSQSNKKLLSRTHTPHTPKNHLYLYIVCSIYILTDLHMHSCIQTNIYLAQPLQDTHKDVCSIKGLFFCSKFDFNATQQEF